jgi:hypothetical protein
MHPFLDWQVIAPFALLWTMAVGAIGYLIGRNHGWTDGFYRAQDRARGEWIPKLIKAKRDGMHAGRILGMQQRITTLTNSERDLRAQLHGTFQDVTQN